MLTQELFLQMWDYSCSKEMRERGFFHLNLRKNPMKSREQSLREGVSEWNEVGVLHTPILALYLKSKRSKWTGRCWAQRLLDVGESGAQ
jgi:hypothetical protein